jgi:hypothetical protein
MSLDIRLVDTDGHTIQEFEHPSDCMEFLNGLGYKFQPRDRRINTNRTRTMTYVFDPLMTTATQENYKAVENDPRLRVLTVVIGDGYPES